MKKVTTKKHLGQHFLVSGKVQEQISSDFLELSDAIFEIGPGIGAITKHLCQNEQPFFVIEKDLRFKNHLEEFLDSNQIIMGDALEVDLDQLLKERNYNGKKVWLVSNLPYNVSVPLLLKFLKCPQIDYMTLMFQKEVGLKVFEDINSKNNMGSLRVLSESFFDVSKLCDVPPDAFDPPPEVDSIVLSFTRKSKPIINLEDFDQLEFFVRCLFRFKRKQIQKVLKSFIHGIDSKSLLEKVEIMPNLRAEALTLEQVIDLYDCCQDYLKVKKS